MSASTTPVHDILGIGFGPANLALAIALEERESPLTARFLEARPSPEWQPGMLLDGSDIQNHPSRDLVTLRNPRSRYTFLNYLHEQGRLLRHLNLPSEFPLRKEYAGYIRWAAGFFSHLVDCNQRAARVEIVEEFGERLYEVTTMSGSRYLGRTLVMGPGRTPYVPAPYDALRTPRIFHLTQYLPKLAELTGGGRAPESVAVIGGSQSAVELALDLHRRFPRTKVTTYTRSHSLRLKDTSPFSEEGYFPEFTEYYFRASREGKKALDAYMHGTNYSSADGDVLRDLYMTIYEQELDGDQKVFVRGNHEAVGVAREGADRIALDFVERTTGERISETVDFAVLATGFRNMGPGPHEEPCPPTARSASSGTTARSTEKPAWRTTEWISASGCCAARCRTSPATASATALYQAVYQDRFTGRQRLHMHKRTEVTAVDQTPDGRVRLRTEEVFTGGSGLIEADAVIVCTGYREAALPRPLAAFVPHLRLDAQGRPEVTRAYRARTTEDCEVGIYLDGLTEWRHGIGSATSFSQMAAKADTIHRDLRARLRHPVAA